MVRNTARFLPVFDVRGDQTMNTMTYKSYTAKVEYSEEDDRLRILAARFYAHFGFVPMPGQSNRLLLPAKALRA